MKHPRSLRLTSSFYGHGTVGTFSGSLRCHKNRQPHLAAELGVMNSLKPKICRGRHDTIMQQLTRTELRVEYFERTSHFDLPDEIELALENDYIINRDIYTDTVLEMIQMTYFLHEMVTPEEMLEHVHRTSKNS